MEHADLLLLNLVEHGLQPLALRRNTFSVALLIALDYVREDTPGGALVVTQDGIDHARTLRPYGPGKEGEWRRR